MPQVIVNNKNSSALEIWKIKRERLSLIALPEVLEVLGAVGNQDRDKNKWKIPGIGNIIVKGQQWLNGNLQISGYGSVKLVRHALEMEKDTEAMNWLLDKFPDSLGGNWKKEIAQFKSQEEIKEESSFKPPERFDDGLEDVKNYLVQKRRLPLKLIEKEIDSGRLYATRQKFEHSGGRVSYGEAQCVFIGPSSAEIRSTKDDGFKGCCEGSDSDNSSYQVMFLHESNKKIAITEAAVDALSFHAIEPNSYVVSTNGAGRFEQQYKLTLEAYRNGFGVQWGFDADFAGDLASQRLFNALFLREKLSEEWGVSKDIIDEWIIQRKIVSIPEESPHELFINNSYAKEKELFPVFESKKVKSDKNNLDVKILKEDSGKKEPATVTYKVVKVCKDTKSDTNIKNGTKGTFKLSFSDVNDLLKLYQLERKRPLRAKDWNEVWTRMGEVANDNYNQLFKKPSAQQKSSSNNSTKKSRFARKIKKP